MSAPFHCVFPLAVRSLFDPQDTDLVAGQSSATSKHLPFSQNKNFIGRQDELDALEQKLFIEQDCQKAAIAGLGGVGKTQVALQFAYSVLERHPDVSVLWVHAMSIETFEHSCRELANVLGILDAADDKEDVRELVRRHLSKKVAGKWVLIVDNADDISVLDGDGGNKSILDYLPESEFGLTVFTTRDKKTAQRLAGNNVVDVEKLELATAADLFKKMLTRKGLSDDETIIDELLGELDFLPLAITQAAAYVNCNLVSIGEYLSYVRGTESNLVYVMSQEMGDPTRDKHAANAVAKTWLVSFDQILQHNPDAAEILQYMSCIEWKAIPRSILPAIEPEARMTTAIGALWSYAFISAREDNETYDMHRLVHLAARIWVGQKGMVREVQGRAVAHLADIFPSDDYDNREVWREYIPHAARIRDMAGNDPTEEKETLCLEVGRCLMVDGRIREAVSWLEESRDLRGKLPDGDSYRSLTEYCLASAYRANGQVKEAVRLLEHVVAINKRVLAEDHPDRLTSQHVLATAHLDDGQVEEAVRLLAHVVAIDKRLLAEDHPDRLTSQRALAEAVNASCEFPHERSAHNTNDARFSRPREEPGQDKSRQNRDYVTLTDDVPPRVHDDEKISSSSNKKWWRKWKNRI
jgi:hypothetical protein